MFEIDTTLLQEGNRMRDRDVEDVKGAEDTNETMNWLENISADEILHWAIKECINLVEEDVADQNLVSEGMNNLVLICCFNQIQEQNLQEIFHNLSMELGNVTFWVHEYSQNLQNNQRYGDENAMQLMNNNNELEKGYATQGDAFESNQGLQEVA